MRLAALVVISSVLAVGSAAAVVGLTSSTGSPPTFPCGSPKTNGYGQPTAAVILLDGVPSEEDGGTYYPFPVRNPIRGVPTVLNYCPLNSRYEERLQPDLPSGLDISLRRWSEFSVPGTSSGGSSAPEATHACDRAQPATIPAPRPGPAPGSTTPSTAASVTVGTIPGGFGKGTCLTEALANAGAVLLPYSYAGAVLKTSGQFSQQSYTAADSQQPLCSSVAYLAREITSIHAAWPHTRIVVVGHSFGGLVAETWWFDEHPTNGGHCMRPTGLSSVVHVFSLDSPINGVKDCEAAHQVLGAAASTWCDLWYGPNRYSPAGAEGVANDTQIAAIDDHELSFTAVGTPNDPTYGEGITGGGGGLRAQLVSRCANGSIFTDYSDSHAPCIDRTGGALPVSYPSGSPQCDAGSGNIYLTTGHDLVKVCPPVVRLIVSALRANPQPPPVTASAYVMCFNPNPMPEQAPASCAIFGEPEIEANLIILSQVHWSSWGRGTTIGSGVEEPTHPGQPGATSMPVIVTLSDPASRCHGNVFYTKLAAHSGGQVQQFGSGGALQLSGACEAIMNMASQSGTQDWFRSPSGNISCELDYGVPGLADAAYCQTISPAKSVTMATNGALKTCSGQRCLGNGPENQFVLSYGNATGLGPFDCSSSASRGITCTVAEGGGVAISKSGVTRVGP